MIGDYYGLLKLTSRNRRAFTGILCADIFLSFSPISTRVDVNVLYFLMFFKRLQSSQSKLYYFGDYFLFTSALIAGQLNVKLD